MGNMLRPPGGFVPSRRKRQLVPGLTFLFRLGGCCRCCCVPRVSYSRDASPTEPCFHVVTDKNWFLLTVEERSCSLTHCCFAYGTEFWRVWRTSTGNVRSGLL